MQQLIHSVLNLLDYCIHRILTNKIVNPSWWHCDERTIFGVIFYATLNLMIIYYFVLSLIKPTYTVFEIMIPWSLIPIFYTLSLFRYTDKYIDELYNTTKWKDERYKRLKGWLIVLWYILSLSIFVIILFWLSANKESV